MYYIGWDVHKNKIFSAVFSIRGDVLLESNFNHTIQDAKNHLEGYPPEIYLRILIVVSMTVEPPHTTFLYYEYLNQIIFER